MDVTRGLAYLHQYNIVHGNLTDVCNNFLVLRLGGLTTPQHNILVDSDGSACISEYGLEIILRDEAPSDLVPTNVRWMAPEVLSARSRRIPSGDDGKAADVYSFAMVMFEVGLPRLYCHTQVFLLTFHSNPRF